MYTDSLHVPKFNGTLSRPLCSAVSLFFHSYTFSLLRYKEALDFLVNCKHVIGHFVFCLLPNTALHDKSFMSSCNCLEVELKSSEFAKIPH
jgi:hypothetical protein